MTPPGFGEAAEGGATTVVQTPFKVVDEDGVEWNLRLTSFDGQVSIEAYRFKPGERIQRDLARMDVSQALFVAGALERLAKTAGQEVVDEVHEL